MILCGIDEAGRGPLAGPLAVAGCILTGSVDGLNDSKKLTEKKREALFEAIVQNSKYHLVWHSASQIDSLGLSKCIKASLDEIISTLQADEYLFDGSCNFGCKGVKTMIKADASVQEVMAASIIAKVSRDNVMSEAAKKYSNYGFEKHKGYGTKAHMEAIKNHGISELHRKSFCTKMQTTLF